VSSGQNEWQQQQADTNDEIVDQPEEAESATISKSLLKRLYNELKRLKTLATQTTLVEKEMVGEPMYQQVHDELIARGFREKDGAADDYHDDLIARGFREKAVRRDLNLNGFRLKRQMRK
jgi:hypothetical protein